MSRRGAAWPKELPLLLLPALLGATLLARLSPRVPGDREGRATGGDGEPPPRAAPGAEESRYGLSRAQLAQTLQLISGRWVLPLLDQLASGPKRYSQLRAGLDGISEKVLTETLRRMERDGLVTQVVSPGHSSRHLAYQATPLARSLEVALKAVAKWQAGHWEQVIRARAQWSGR